MNQEARNDSDHSSHDGSSPGGQNRRDEVRKPFVKPELRRETGLVDGTAGQFSNMSGD